MNYISGVFNPTFYDRVLQSTIKNKKHRGSFFTVVINRRHYKIKLDSNQKYTILIPCWSYSCRTSIAPLQLRLNITNFVQMSPTSCKTSASYHQNKNNFKIEQIFNFITKRFVTFVTFLSHGFTFVKFFRIFLHPKISHHQYFDFQLKKKFENIFEIFHLQFFFSHSAGLISTLYLNHESSLWFMLCHPWWKIWNFWRNWTSSSG